LGCAEIASNLGACRRNYSFFRRQPKERGAPFHFPTPLSDFPTPFYDLPAPLFV
jgi:hypothetical protein